MIKKLALALPLASLLFVVGCCSDDTCNTCAITPSAPAVVAVAPVKAEAVVTEAVVVDEEDDVALIEEEEEVEVAEVEEAPAPVVKEAPKATAASCPSVIPADTLPEGWGYFSETDLAGGKLNTQSLDELYASK